MTHYTQEENKMEKEAIYEKVISYIRENNLISPQDTIVEGISGGADSVCLFLMLEEYKKKSDSIRLRFM